jgi:hypothetical protein
MTPYLLHCIACRDLRNVRITRTSCACGRSSARAIGDDTVILLGPGRIVDAALEAADVRLIRPSVAVAS